jgi:hypothetical protein
MREVIRHAANCPKGPVPSGLQGVPDLVYQITRIEDPRLSHPQTHPAVASTI